jgi:hypothetical protein
MKFVPLVAVIAVLVLGAALFASNGSAASSMANAPNISAPSLR